MAIKDFFDNKKPLSSKNLDDLSEIEDSSFIRSKSKKNKDFHPKVDYTIPSEFAFYGRAEKYYEDTFDYIAGTFPYDGSGVEKLEWYNSSSYIDKYFYNHVYPRRNGHIRFFQNSGTSLTKSGGTWEQNYYKHSDPHYVGFRGSLNTGSKIQTSLADGFEEANTVDSSTSRLKNLRYNLDEGITVEFWMKNNSPDRTSVVFDMWNESLNSSDLGRFTIEVSGSSLAIAAQSGSKNDIQNEAIGDFTNIDVDSWNHYCVRAYNTGSDFQADLFVNGNKNDSLFSASYALSEVTGTLSARINTFIADKFDSGAVAVNLKDYGAISGSIDEFRFWNTKRNDKEIKRFWKSDVFGGSDKEKGNTKLGIYYKFNEGITQTSSVDHTILDYSGRITNGIYNNYSTLISSGLSPRSTSSAIREATDNKEFKDPVIYSFHPDVKSLRDTYKIKGQVYDYNNNNSLYNSVPQWIIEEGGEIGKLTQIMGSYLDTLYAQTTHLADFKNKTYVSSSEKPIPFLDRLLTNQGFVAPEVFANADQLAKIYNREEDVIFDEDLNDIKGLIYKNIYNNITEIYKSKGTKRSFRNLLRCYGLNEDIVSIRYYLDNNEANVSDIRDEAVSRKNYIDFSRNDNKGATIYQHDIDSDSVSYITGSTDFLSEAFTFQTHVRFPNKPKANTKLYPEFFYNNLTSSLFGVYNPPTANPDNIEFASNQYGFQVYSVRDDVNFDRIKFKLTSSAGVFDLETSNFYDSYDNSDWLVNVMVKPSKGNNTDFVSGSENTTQDYDIEFYGIETVGKNTVNSFYLTSSMTSAEANNFYTNPKRVYAGAERQDFTGSVLNRTDVKIGAVRTWLDYVDRDTIATASYNIDNYGNKIGDNNFNPNFDYEVTSPERLIFNWEFDDVSTGSLSTTVGSRFGFTSNDVTSGSNSETRYGQTLDDLLMRSYGARGDNYTSKTNTSVKREHVVVSKPKMLDDSLNSNEISIRDSNTEEFGKNKITTKIVRVEKSIFNAISDEMLNWVGSVVEFNNLIGHPHSQYSYNYNQLDKLRQLFFKNVGKSPNVEKYLKYYKWFDSALSSMIKELIPASANIIGDVENTIENHAFTRNKKFYKPISLKRKMFNTVFAASSEQSELNSNWDALKPPINNSTTESLTYWKYIADRSTPAISSGDSEIDSDRNQIRDILSSGLDKIGSTETIRNPFSKRFRKINNAYQTSFSKKNTPHETIGVSILVANYFTEPLGIEGAEKYFFKSNYTEAQIKALSSTHLLWNNKEAPFNVVYVGSNTTVNYIEHSPTIFDIVNHLNDLYGEFERDPLQGPYAKDKVGGSFARHNSVLRDIMPENRSEEFFIEQSTGFLDELINISSAKYFHKSDAFTNSVLLDSQPRAYTYRDQIAKRPFSIKNIKHTGSTVGNFDKNHEVINSVGRKNNNVYLRDNEEFDNDNGSTYIYPENPKLRSFVDGGSFTQDKNFKVTEFSGSDTIIASRFAAPGEKDFNNLGTHDVFSREYTNYSTVNYRNLKARKVTDDASEDHFDVENVPVRMEIVVV